MQINDMVLVISNLKGEENNMLMTKQQYLKTFIFDKTENESRSARLSPELYDTKENPKLWCETYYAANKSVSARYCFDYKQLVDFLRGEFNNPMYDFSFLEEESSKECIEKLKELNLSTDGWNYGSLNYHYEKRHADFEQGDILHNMNGTDYRVLEVLTDRNLILMNLETGQFVVALGTENFVRYPKLSEPTEHNTEYGVEWDHGLYLGSTPSKIDFEKLRREYGIHDEREQETGEGIKEYVIEVRESLSRLVTVKAESETDAMELVRDMYDEEKIVLDAGDFKDVDFSPAEGVTREIKKQAR